VRSILRTNFVIAVWLTVALGAIILWVGWPTPNTDFSLGRYTPGSGAVELGFACILGEIGLWFYQFREDTNDNAALSGFVGGLLLIPLFEIVISDAVNGLPTTWWLLVPAYLAFSHLGYAAHCWSDGRKSLLDL
jgi:hypothetical protein